MPIIIEITDIAQLYAENGKLRINAGVLFKMNGYEDPKVTVAVPIDLDDNSTFETMRIKIYERAIEIVRELAAQDLPSAEELSATERGSALKNDIAL